MGRFVPKTAETVFDELGHFGDDGEMRVELVPEVRFWGEW